MQNHIHMLHNTAELKNILLFGSEGLDNVNMFRLYETNRRYLYPLIQFRLLDISHIFSNFSISVIVNGIETYSYVQ